MEWKEQVEQVGDSEAHEYAGNKASDYEYAAEADEKLNDAHGGFVGLTIELTCGRQTAKRAGERQVERRVRLHCCE
jgi:hypothetical protein